MDKNKRALLKKAAYVAPAIVTMAVIPSFASAGSGNPCHGVKAGKGRIATCIKDNNIQPGDGR